MINKDEFYGNEDNPSSPQRERMWKVIDGASRSKKMHIFNIGDRRSFYLGMAASVILFFTVVGAYVTTRQIVYSMKPEEVKVNNAYQSAIKEFEKVVPSVVSSMQTSEGMRSYMDSKREHLRLLDEAIAQMKNESAGQDLSPLKQLHLRQLYTEKLIVLQEIAEKGNTEL